MKSIILERFTSTGKILESDKKNLPEGVLCKAKYQICSVGKKNRNNRIYEREVWERVLADEDVKEKLKNRSLFFHAEHPETTQSNTEKVAGIVSEIIMEGNIVYAIMEVLETPYGKIIDTLLKAGCGIGVSTRADGELEEAIDEDGNKYSKVVPSSYKFVTVDFTADPSSYGSEMPIEVKRGVVEVVKKSIDDKKIDTEYATTLLEHMNIRESKKILKSLKVDKHHEGCQCLPTEKKCLKCSHKNEEKVEEALHGEISGGKEEITCSECGRKLPLQVCKSGAGYYYGYACPNCGPYGRESGYFGSKEEAEAAMHMKVDMRDTGYHPEDPYESVNETTKQDVFQWIEDNVRARGLIPTIGMTAPAVLKAFPDLVMGQAREVVRQYKEEKGIDFDESIEEAFAIMNEAWNVGDEVGVEGDSSVGMNDWKGTITFIKDDYAIVKDEQGEEEEIMLRSLYKIEESVNEGQGEYYAEKEGNDWGVFNTDSVGKFASGHCFALFSDKQQADDKAKELNGKLKEGQEEVCYACHGKGPFRKETDELFDFTMKKMGPNPEKKVRTCKRCMDQYLSNVGESVKEGASEDFIRFLQTTLIPDLKASQSIATAEDFETLIQFMNGKKNVGEFGSKTEFEQYLENVLIPDLEEGGKSATADDFEKGLRYLRTTESKVYEVIKKVGSKWQVQSHEGKNLGTYDTEAEAKKRLGQVEYFKKNESMKTNPHVVIDGKTYKIFRGEGKVAEIGSEDKVAISSFNHEAQKKILKRLEESIREAKTPKDLVVVIKSYYKEITKDKNMPRAEAIKHLALIANRSEDEVKKILKEDVQMTIEAPDKKINQFLSDNWSQFLNDEDAVNNLVKVFKINASKAKEFVDSMAKGKGKLSIQYAMENKRLIENYGKDCIKFTEKIKKLEEKIIEDSCEYMMKFKMLQETKECSIVALKERLDETNNKLKEHLDRTENKIKELKEVHKKELLKIYTETKLKCMGLKLNERRLTILESCKSTSEVDEFIREFQNAITESALQFSGASEISISVTQEKKDPKQVEIDRKVGSAMSAWTGGSNK